MRAFRTPLSAAAIFVLVAASSLGWTLPVAHAQRCVDARGNACTATPARGGGGGNTNPSGTETPVGPTSTPTALPTATPKPTRKPAPTKTATLKPTETATQTATLKLTSTKTATPKPSQTAAAIIKPTSTVTATPVGAPPKPGSGLPGGLGWLGGGLLLLGGLFLGGWFFLNQGPKGGSPGKDGSENGIIIINSKPGGDGGSDKMGAQPHMQDPPEPNKPGSS
jgi:hypothetical protein